LVTHTPPVFSFYFLYSPSLFSFISFSFLPSCLLHGLIWQAFHRDLRLGCEGLLEEVWRVKPKLHVFGHVHWGHGCESVYYDECQRAFESFMARTGKGFIYDFYPSAAWMDAFNVIWYGISSVLWKWVMLGPGSNNGAVMVNASVMYGNTGKVKNPAVVVDL